MPLSGIVGCIGLVVPHLVRLAVAAAHRYVFPGAALAETITKCRIDHLIGRRFNTLSGGERQRVHFARALLQVWRASTSRGALDSTNSAPAPRYMLLDEPTASLDLAQQLSVLRLARRASEGNIGVLTVLHDLNLAARFADWVVLLAQGAVLAAGAPSAVLTNALLGRVYKTPVRVEKHRQLDRLMVYTE